MKEEKKSRSSGFHTQVHPEGDGVDWEVSAGLLRGGHHRRTQPAPSWLALVQHIQQHGVPPHKRAAVWPALLSQEAVDWAAVKAQYAQLRAVAESFQRAQEFCMAQGAPEDYYVGVLRMLEVDVPRAPRSCAFLQGEAREQGLVRLRAVLEAVCLVEPEVGYWQGFGDIAAPILAVFDEDSQAFWALRQILAVRLRHTFATPFKQPSLPASPSTQQPTAPSALDALWDEIHKVGRILKHADPKLYSHLAQLAGPYGQSPTQCSFQMIHIYFSRELPVEQLQVFWETMWACEEELRLSDCSGSTISNSRHSSLDVMGAYASHAKGNSETGEGVKAEERHTQGNGKANGAVNGLMQNGHHSRNSREYNPSLESPSEAQAEEAPIAAWTTGPIPGIQIDVEAREADADVAASVADAQAAAQPQEQQQSEQQDQDEEDLECDDRSSSVQGPAPLIKCSSLQVKPPGGLREAQLERSYTYGSKPRPPSDQSQRGEGEESRQPTPPYRALKGTGHWGLEPLRCQEGDESSGEGCLDGLDASNGGQYLRGGGASSEEGTEGMEGWREGDEEWGGLSAKRCWTANGDEGLHVGSCVPVGECKERSGGKDEAFDGGSSRQQGEGMGSVVHPPGLPATPEHGVTCSQNGSPHKHQNGEAGAPLTDSHHGANGLHSREVAWSASLSLRPYGAAALLCAHRQMLLCCHQLENVVQFCNNLPALPISPAALTSHALKLWQAGAGEEAKEADNTPLTETAPFSVFSFGKTASLKSSAGSQAMQQEASPAKSSLRRRLAHALNPFQSESGRKGSRSSSSRQQQQGDSEIGSGVQGGEALVSHVSIDRHEGRNTRAGKGGARDKAGLARPLRPLCGCVSPSSSAFEDR